MLGFLRKKKKKYGVPIYIGEPTIIYHTQTERAILKIIEERLNSNNFILPSEYGLKPTLHMIRDAEVFVAIGIVGKFTSLVVREIKTAQELKKKIYTLNVARKGNEIYYDFFEGIPEDMEWLSEEETNQLYEDFRGEEFSGFMKIFLGDRRRQW
ncbi:hypothetical protein K1720_05890 [Thermococcus argininiproducens]|uniref:Uncharacterized protein n=1 Tax=Thermococcus argininiproducens TaxID=2866384 RepID=A0A9E7SBT0_9EURY|nr:hypothetical protein [Thermococcus argininiproducens]USG99080.1 hypothetical protein K1720_05890 [Thermococcus argininiproducens]